MYPGEMIKKRRKDLGYSADYVAKTLGVSRSTVFRYENGDIEKMPADVLNPLAKLLQTTPAHLMGWTDDAGEDFGLDNLYRIDIKKFPMLGKVACGEPIFAEQNFEGYVMAGANIPADFCLRVKGDSMINARIFDGDIVFIRKQPDVNNGEIAVVLIGGEATLKRVYKYKNRMELRPENPLYPVLEFEGEDLINIRILGKAVAFQSDVI